MAIDYKKLSGELAIEVAALRATAESGANLALTPGIVAKHLKAYEDGDQIGVRVVDDAGNPRIGDVQGNPMTPQGLIAELRKQPDFAALFGTSKSGQQAGPKGGKKRSDMSIVEKGDYVAKHGHDAFMALPA